MRNAEVRVVARRRTPVEADQVAAEFEASGLSRKDFCQRRGLKISTLDAYRKRRRWRQAEMSGSQRWVAVEVKEASPHVGGRSGLAVVLAGGRRIEVEAGFDGGTLERLLTLLERG